MNTHTYISSLFLAIVFFIGCSVEPKPIQYGVDNCHYCNMTIVDDKHSAELVTAKGKVYKFDAIECMIRNIHSDPNQEYKYLLIADYNSPGELIDAKQGYYLISENLPSPMGENLSGFSAKDVIDEHQSIYGGEIYSWIGINSFMDSN